MWIVYLLAIAAGPVLIFLLAMGGRRLREAAATPVPDGVSWPSVGLVLPCAGMHPDMEKALRSLLAQNYEGRRRVVFVTATADEPAAELVERLCEEYRQRLDVAHVVAGMAGRCGQKNFNSLAGVAYLGDSVEVYAFADSTHLASPDFLGRLVLPLALGQASFATGYHEVVPRDAELVTLAYTLTVLVMRLMQGMSGFTQPWGGAMACRRDTFREKGIGALWAENVVDDCSLVTHLRSAGVKVALSPAALVRTRAGHHSFDVWSAWLERQILFLRFCVPSQWVLLLGVLVFMAILPALAFLGFLGGLVGLLGAGSVLAGLVYLAATAVSLSYLRPLLPHHVPLMRCLGAFWLVCFTACGVCLKSALARDILWHGIRYEVGPGGRVRHISRHQA